MNVERAVEAAEATAAELGLDVDDVTVLHASDRVTLRLAPCDVVVRVARGTSSAWADREVRLAGRMAEAGAPTERPAAGVEPRAHEHDGLALTFWRYHEPIPPAELGAAEYADLLARHHAALRTMDDATSHRLVDRIAEAEQTITDPNRCSPDVSEDDRTTLLDIVREASSRLAGSDQQLLHGEPHPGNVLRTRDGLLLVDLETCCRGPVEFDLVHGPADAADHYPGVDRAVLDACGTLALALATAWRFDRDDNLPNGAQLRDEWLAQLRATTT